MKKVTNTLLAASMIATLLIAADAAVTAVKVDVDLSRVSYGSSVWKDARFSEVLLYPQTTIKLNDKKANEINADNKAKKAEVAAVYNGENIAFMIKWPDKTMSIQQNLSTTSYADAFAIQFASNYSNPEALPYIGMGSEGRPVVVHMQKAVRSFFEPNGHGDVAMQMNRNQTNLFEDNLKKFDSKVKRIGSNDYERTFISEGFRSMTEIKDGSNHSYARLSYKKDSWMGTLSRPMVDGYVNLSAGAIPVAFAIWDGEKMGRGGLKNLSQWISVKLEGRSGGDELIAALSAQVAGDAALGKKAAAVNGCIECHQIEADETANFRGPALNNVGGYATAGYLKESLMKPSAVVVPGYNLNAHSNHMWYTQENGKRISTMKDYSWLDEKTMNDIIAYLQTLKAKVE